LRRDVRIPSSPILRSCAEVEGDESLSDMVHGMLEQEEYIAAKELN